MQQILNFIDGEFICSNQSANLNTQNDNAFFKHIKPFDGLASHVVNSDAIDLVKAIQGANKAYLEWRDSSIQQRIELLDKILNELNLKQKEFAEIEAWEQGLNYDFCLNANIHVSLEKLKLYKNELEKYSEASYLSIGVVGVILSWNLATRLFVEKVIPAILAGNAVVVKVSSHAPSTAKLWGELLQAVGLPKGLIQILHSQNVAFKRLFLTHPGIKALIFTGELANASTVLREVASISQQQFKKIQINTGSKNTCAVLADLSEEQMGEVFNSFMNGCGQLVWNSARLFILEKYEKQWLEYVAHKLQQLKPSESIYDSSAWTPLIKIQYLNKFQELQSQALADQAKIITVATKSKSANFVEPFFTKDMSNCSTLQQDQVFGPAFIISTVKYGFDIPKYSNVSYFGHSANVWTEEGKNQKITQQLDVGLVSLNKWSIYCVESVAGVKQSAFGLQDSKIFGAFYSNAKKII